MNRTDKGQLGLLNTGLPKTFKNITKQTSKVDLSNKGEIVNFMNKITLHKRYTTMLNDIEVYVKDHPTTAELKSVFVQRKTRQ